MADVVETTGKTVEAALAAALTQLGTTADQVNYEVLSQPSRGFLGLIGVKPARIRVSRRLDSEKSAVSSAEPVLKNGDAAMDRAVTAEAQVVLAETFLRNVFAAMHIDLAMERSESEEGTVFNLAGEDLGILIGKHGQTLDSLQYLTNLVANKNSNERVRVIIDVEDYRDRRIETLNRLAARLADKVKRTGERVALEPMNPHERKIIHMALQGDRRVTTLSEGDEPYRHVVIELKK